MSRAFSGSCLMFADSTRKTTVELTVVVHIGSWIRVCDNCSCLTLSRCISSKWVYRCCSYLMLCFFLQGSWPKRRVWWYYVCLDTLLVLRVGIDWTASSIFCSCICKEFSDCRQQDYRSYRSCFFPGLGKGVSIPDFIFLEYSPVSAVM